MNCSLALLQALAVAALCGDLACAQPASIERPADKPVPRADRDSQLAHEQLVAKAKLGGIDVYFLGDSITRRWGATDYPGFLANWRSNSKLADGKKIRYLNVNDKLADKDGKLFEGIAKDKLHPGLNGYQIWADGLKPIFTEILGPPAKTDHAPPSTGDPSA